MQAPPPVELTRTTPRVTTRPDGNRRGWVYGICEERGCTYVTPSFHTSGFIASLASAHGLVLSDEPTPGVPVCPSVVRVAAAA